jgi:hypothetical protein
VRNPPFTSSLATFFFIPIPRLPRGISRLWLAFGGDEFHHGRGRNATTKYMDREKDKKEVSK